MPAEPVGSAAIAADRAAQADERAAAELLQPRADRLGLGCDFLSHDAAMRAADEKLKAERTAIAAKYEKSKAYRDEQLAKKQAVKDAKKAAYEPVRAARAAAST